MDVKEPTVRLVPRNKLRGRVAALAPISYVLSVKIRLLVTVPVTVTLSAAALPRVVLPCVEKLDETVTAPVVSAIVIAAVPSLALMLVTSRLVRSSVVALIEPAFTAPETVRSVPLNVKLAESVN